METSLSSDGPAQEGTLDMHSRLDPDDDSAVITAKREDLDRAARIDIDAAIDAEISGLGEFWKIHFAALLRAGKQRRKHANK